MFTFFYEKTDKASTSGSLLFTDRDRFKNKSTHVHKPFGEVLSKKEIFINFHCISTSPQMKHRSCMQLPISHLCTILYHQFRMIIIKHSTFGFFSFLLHYTILEISISFVLHKLFVCTNNIYRTEVLTMKQMISSGLFSMVFMKIHSK